MTTAIPRRLFDDPGDNQQEEANRKTIELREQGLIRVHGVITIELNDRIKAAARREGIHADQLIGQLITKSQADVDRIEAQHEAIRLRQRFGEQWIDVIKTAADKLSPF